MWYSVDLLFRSRRTDGSIGLCEEQIVLVTARDEEEAREKARKVGAGKEVTYDTASGERLEWTLYRAAEICELDVDVEAFQDGLEVFSRFLDESDVEGLLTPLDE